MLNFKKTFLAILFLLNSPVLSIGITDVANFFKSIKAAEPQSNPESTFILPSDNIIGNNELWGINATPGSHVEKYQSKHHQDTLEDIYSPFEFRGLCEKGRPNYDQFVFDKHTAEGLIPLETILNVTPENLTLDELREKQKELSTNTEYYQELPSKIRAHRGAINNLHISWPIKDVFQLQIDATRKAHKVEETRLQEEINTGRKLSKALTEIDNKIAQKTTLFKNIATAAAQSAIKKTEERRIADIRKKTIENVATKMVNETIQNELKKRNQIAQYKLLTPKSLYPTQWSISTQLIPRKPVTDSEEWNSVD